MSAGLQTVFEATGATGSIEIGFAETVRSGEDKANACLRSGRAAWNRIGAEEEIYLRFSRCGEREHGGTSDKQSRADKEKEKVFIPKKPPPADWCGQN